MSIIIICLYFYNFARTRSYLSTSGNPDEQDRVLDNADPSSLIPISGSVGYNGVTTEFCYASNAFYVDSLANTMKRFKDEGSLEQIYLTIEVNNQHE